MEIRIKRGLDVPVPGAPRQAVADGPAIGHVAVLGADYPGVRFKIAVEVGARVARGQALLIDRHRPEIVVTAPDAGEVAAIERGPRRSLAALVIRRDGDDAVAFDRPAGKSDGEAARALLMKSGLWPAFVARPFGRIPDPDAVADAIFVTAMDTNPLAADAAVVLAPYLAPFRSGLQVLTALTEGPVYVCQAPGPDLAEGAGERVRTVRFRGPHPAGLAGTHVHHIAPVGGGRRVWQINYQDVIAIGMLFDDGRLWSERVVAVAGPAIRDPALFRVPLGANIDELLAGMLKPGPARTVSGSVLSGRVSHYLGRYHQQVSVLPAIGGPNRRGLLARLWRGVADAAADGWPAPIIPTAAHERVLPFRILPVPLLRALAVGDDETASRLGCLELLEEDMALLSYACSSETDYGPLLRRTLDSLAEAA